MKTSRPSFQAVRLGVAILGGLILAVLATGCDGEKSTAGGPGSPLADSQVRWVPVEVRGVPSTEEVMGTVHARLRAVVEARIPGRIESLQADPGLRVTRGTTLALLDAREIQARLDSATAVMDQATRDLERTTRLWKDGAATVAERDAIQARHLVAEAAVAEARAQLAHTKVVAPFDGVITLRLADVGDLASPGRPLVEIEDPSHLRFELDVPEALIDRIQMGAVLPVRMGNPALDLQGTVSELAPVADAASRTFRVKLDLPVTQGVRAGQFGRVAIPTSEAQVLQVPSTAVVRRGQLEFVYVADQGKASLRLIRTGRVFGPVSEVVTGLRAGEKVVEKPDSGLRDGQHVEGTP